jgi:hypothetical protein
MDLVFVFFAGWLGYEGNLGADADQESPTKPAKIQQICAFELGGFGSSRTEFSHSKGIGRLHCIFDLESSGLRLDGKPALENVW